MTGKLSKVSKKHHRKPESGVFSWDDGRKPGSGVFSWGDGPEECRLSPDEGPR